MKLSKFGALVLCAGLSICAPRAFGAIAMNCDEYGCCSVNLSTLSEDLLNISPSRIYNKAMTKTGSWSDGATILGYSTIKFGKMAKNGMVKVTVTLKPFFGKNQTASGTFKPKQNGILVGSLKFKNGYNLDFFAGVDREGDFVYAGESDNIACIIESCPSGGTLEKGYYTLEFDYFDLTYAPKNFKSLECYYSYPTEYTGYCNGTKFDFGKSPKLKYAKNLNHYDLYGLDDPQKPNINNLTLKYNKKTGALSGSYKLYLSNEEYIYDTTPTKKPTLKSYTGKINGAVFDDYPAILSTIKISGKESDAIIYFSDYPRSYR